VSFHYQPVQVRCYAIGLYQEEMKNKHEALCGRPKSLFGQD